VVEVISGVHDDGERSRRERSIETVDEARAPDSARQRDYPQVMVTASHA
jgi:hypothetical protein